LIGAYPFANVSAVPRFARVVIVEVPHHVTQRANARRFILAEDTERALYLDLLREYAVHYQLAVLGYGLMSNHVHRVVIPRRTNSMALALKHTHGRYAAYWNVRQGSSGHAWQGRFYSCPLDEHHLWAALRYVELNPVRAGMVSAAADYRWSSAAAHCGAAPDPLLDMTRWRERWNFLTWGAYLGATVSEEELEALRESTHTGRPLGTPEFVQELEKTLLRRLTRQKGGRPAKKERDERQAMLSFQGRGSDS